MNQNHPNHLTQIALRSLHWAKSQNYQGYSKFDALNSPILELISRKSRFLRKAFTFALSRSPLNIRPLLLVQKKQNPKGLALFAAANLNLYKITHDETLKTEALHLLNILLNLSKKNDFSGHCWGYDHPWQNIAFFIPPYQPNCVVTCTTAQAFLLAWQITKDKQYLDVCESAAAFLMNDLTQIDVGPDMNCCSYDLNSSWKVINVNAFAAALLAKLYKITQNDAYKSHAQKTMKWVLSQKTPDHAWFYTDPPEQSRITHDNYHTGFVLDAILDYLDVFPDKKIEKDYLEGLSFYRDHLFTKDHAPKWMFDRSCPHDIHGAAQGIITFTRAAKYDPQNLQRAQHILDWTLKNLYHPKQSRFYYQKSKYWTKRYTLMRWSQAWMAYALSIFLNPPEIQSPKH